jgi:hypothetical protein
MKRLIAIIALLVCFRIHAAVTLQWNYDFTGVSLERFMVFHGTDNLPPEIYNVGLATNWTYQPQLTLGTHYFAVVAVSAGGSFSDWSAMAAVTNVQAVAVQTITFTSTNLRDWSPWTTNRVVLCATNPAEFFRSATTIQPTNVLLVPPAPR